MRVYLTYIVIVIVFASCKTEKFKVQFDEYSNGKPRIIYYFDNEEDAKHLPIVIVKNGIGLANKSVSFDEERFFENGNLQSKGRYIKGQSCGLWQYFYETGIPQAKCYYLNGVTRDSVFCWNSTGSLKRVLIEIDTTNHYWHGFDYFANGKKSIECNLVKDILDNWTVEGNWNEWYENGRDKFQATVKNNWTIGKWQEWDTAGNLKVGDKPINITF